MGSPSAHGPPCSGPARVGSGYRVEWDPAAKEQAQGSLLQRQSPALREKRGGWGCRCGQHGGRARGSEVVREEQVSQVDATPTRCGRAHEVREQSGHGGTQICGKTGTAQGTKWADEGYKAWPGALSGALPPVWLSATWMNLAVLGPALDLSRCLQPIRTCQETRHSRGLASQSRVHRSPPEPCVGTAHLQRQRPPGQAESAL